MNAQDWISVEDRLPETTGLSRDYLAVLEDGDMIVLSWMNVGGWDWNHETLMTHWMPLPEPPARRTHSPGTPTMTGSAVPARAMPVGFATHAAAPGPAAAKL